MVIKHFFHAPTWTLTYVVYDPESRDAVVIDPVLDYDPRGVAVSTESADDLASFLEEEGLNVHYVLETHAHADHLSGSQALRERFGARVAIGSGITTVQQTFAEVFDFGGDFAVDGSQFDRLLDDGDVLDAGTLSVTCLSTPGHTPACTSFHIGDAVFTGDLLFMPDSGTGRCDFPGGSAEQQFASVGRIYALPAATLIFVGHDYLPGGRPLAFETTVGESREHNRMLPASMSRAAFVVRRVARDRTLQAPNLIFQSIQVNIRAGRLPEPAANGIRYLKLPMGVFS